jgi:hypothetical protein
VKPLLTFGLPQALEKIKRLEADKDGLYGFMTAERWGRPVYLYLSLDPRIIKAKTSVIPLAK